jgi:hypothetical protein
VSPRCFLLRKGADGVTDRPLAICLVIDGAAGQNLQRGRSRTDQPVAQKVHLVLVELVSGAICQVLASERLREAGLGLVELVLIQSLFEFLSVDLVSVSQR